MNCTHSATHSATNSATHYASNIVAIVGNIISILLFLSPSPTIISIWRNGTVMEFSSVPYLVTCCSCIIGVLSALPSVQDNVLLLTVNGVGTVIEMFYIFVFYWYAKDKPQRTIIICAGIIQVIFHPILFSCTLTLPRKTEDKAKVAGIVSVLFSASMYASPLTILETVIRTKNVENLPLCTSLASLLNSLVWTAYGVLRQDLYIFVANVSGIISSSVQLVLHAVYFKSTRLQIAAREEKERQLAAREEEERQLAAREELGDGSEMVEIPVMKEENVVDIVGNDSSNSDQEAVGNMEPLERRRWNSESVKVLEGQSSSLTPATTPKDAVQPNPLRRNFSRSDSLVSDEPPKERVVPPSQKPPTNALRIHYLAVPPSQKPPTNALRIDSFLPPSVQELLGKTGNVTSFWMDQIKTHCFVSYSSIEEAIETRNAVYLQWPPNGGRLLVAEFVDPQEVKMKLEAPPQSPTTPVTPAAPVPATAQPILQPQLAEEQAAPKKLKMVVHQDRQGSEGPK